MVGIVIPKPVLPEGADSGYHERRLLEDLMGNYNKLERPVYNESDAVNLTFGLTLQQIIDVVSPQPLGLSLPI